MKKLQYIIGAIALISSVQATAQDFESKKFTDGNKGKFFAYWGGNRGYFSNSDLHFKGADYDFVVHDASAHDRPKGWHIDYINPLRLTIPQTNFRMGYFFSDKWNVSLGFDHMKYVMTQNQVARVTGHYPNVGSYNEVMPDGMTKLTPHFLQFEHTDGLNYVNTEFTYTEDISKYLGIRNTDKIQINALAGAGVGFLYPRTDATVLGRGRKDSFNVAGWGTGAKIGANITLFKHFFIQYESKVGYIDIVKSPTSDTGNDSVSHDFTFFQTIIAVGGIIKIN